MGKFNMNLFLKGVGIVVAAGGLISAIFGNDDEKKIDELTKRVAELEDKK